MVSERERKMTNVEALQLVLEHAKLDVHAVSTDADREAIKIVEDLINRGAKECPILAQSDAEPMGQKSAV